MTNKSMLRWKSHTSLALAILLVSCLVPGCEKPSIRLQNVPHKPLSLPMPQGTNHMLGATIEGPVADEVWLARADDPSIKEPMARVARNRFEINLGAPSIKRLIKSGPADQELQVVAHFPDGRDVSSSLICIRSSLPTLFLTEEEARLTVNQYDREEVPGSQGSLFLSIGDITSGAVLCGLVDSQGRWAVGRRSLRPGRALEFEVGGSQYAVLCDQLVNYLTGGDYGTFLICEARWLEAKRVAWLVSRIKRCRATFIWQDRSLSPIQFARELEALRPDSTAAGTTLESFVAKVAAAGSADTEKPPKVKLADGAVVDLQPWLQNFAELKEKSSD